MRRVSLSFLLTAACMFLSTSPARAHCEQLFKLLADDAEPVDQFGGSVAIDGTTAIIGAPTANDNGRSSGSAYLFDTVTGEQAIKLLPNDGQANDLFGWGVGVSGTTAIVGARSGDDDGVQSGSAYLFNITTGEQLAKLLADDGAELDQFGRSVAISGDIAIVGAWLDDDNGRDSGSAYLFDISDLANPVQTAKLSGGARDDHFGWAVAIDGTTAVVGAPGNLGSAFVFDAITGERLTRLVPLDRRESSYGRSVAVSGTTVIVGNPREDTDAGSAYLFDISDRANPVQIAKLRDIDGAPNDFFGFSVSISGTIAVVGASRDDDNGVSSGSAFLFGTESGQRIAKILPDDGEAGDQFGGSVAIKDKVVIIGAPQDDDGGQNAGSAYLFDALLCDACLRDPAWVCDGDVDGDGQVNPVDSGLVQAAFGSADEQDVCNYDIDCDGQINPVDSGIVQSLFGTCEAPRDACP